MKWDLKFIFKRKRNRNGYKEIWPLIKGDYVLTFSPDGNSPVEALPRLINKISEGYDMVIGSRYLPPAKSYDDDPITAFGNWLFTITVNILFIRAKYTDVMVLLRIFRTDLIGELWILKPPLILSKNCTLLKSLLNHYYPCEQ